MIILFLFSLFQSNNNNNHIKINKFTCLFSKHFLIDGAVSGSEISFEKDNNEENPIICDEEEIVRVMKSYDV